MAYASKYFNHCLKLCIIFMILIYQLTWRHFILYLKFKIVLRFQNAFHKFPIFLLQFFFPFKIQSSSLLAPKRHSWEHLLILDKFSWTIQGPSCTSHSFYCVYMGATFTNPPILWGRLIHIYLYIRKNVTSVAVGGYKQSVLLSELLTRN